MTRLQALRIVGDYMGLYRAALRRPNLPDTVVTFYHGRIRALGLELATLQTAGPDGDRLARSWGKVVPLG